MTFKWEIRLNISDIQRDGILRYNRVPIPDRKLHFFQVMICIIKNDTHIWWGLIADMYAARYVIFCQDRNRKKHGSQLLRLVGW